MKMKIEIRQITSGDEILFPDALELLNRTQGRDLFGSDYLIRKTTQDTALVLGAFIEKELVAVGVAELIDNFDFYERFDPSLKNGNGTTAGSFSTLCVKEELQGQGIGKAISEKRLQYLKGKKVPFILGVSWVSGKKHTSDRVFEKMGFRPVNKVEKFFVETSLKKPFECPGCLEHPCSCSAILYRLNLN